MLCLLTCNTAWYQWDYEEGLLEKFDFFPLDIG